MISSGNHRFNRLRPFLTVRTLRTLINICLLKANPQDLPTSQRLLIGCVAFTTVVSAITDSIALKNINTSLLVVAQVVLIAVSWRLLLRFTNRMDRWLQSASAIYGTSGVIGLAALPAFINSSSLSQSSDQAPVFVGLAILAIVIWDIAITARIIRETIEVTTVVAVAISLGLRYLYVTIIGTLFTLS